MTKPDPKMLAPLVEAGLDLIPLHAPDHVDDKGRKRGKSPIDGNWTKRLYKSKDQIAHMKRGNNVGVRLTAEFLVLDVDPKNMLEGRDTLAEFLANGDASPVHAAPTVRSGSGGLHYYMRKPADLAIRDSLPEYPGLEFKTVGRQMVAPGSVHPDTGAHYVWVEDELFGVPTGADLTDRPEAPEWLLDLIARPKSVKVDGLASGRYSQDQVAEMLSALNPEDYRNHDDWLRMMMACHHASGGDAREEFIEWATRDPEYADHDKIIGQRWDSLHAEEDGRELVSYKSLLKAVKDAGHLGLLSSSEAETGEDFAEADGPEADQDDPTGVKAIAEHEDEKRVAKSITAAEQAVKELGRKFVPTLNAGKFEVWMRDYDPNFNREYWQPLSKQAFKDYFEDNTVEVPTGNGGSKRMNKADLFLKAPSGQNGKRKYSGVVFDPRPPEMQDKRIKDKLNLWEGWAVKPAPGNWSLFRELIEDVLCAGDAVLSKFVFDWVARMFQQPWEVAESSIVMRGLNGIGKGVFAKVLLHLAGAHGLTVSSHHQVTGRFNSHLRNCVYLFSDEADWNADRGSAGRLKALITEDTASYEQKGRDVVSGRNVVHVVMATNSDWAIPADITERRFLVLDVLPAKRGNRKFFAALMKQMQDGGYAGFLHDMLKRDISEFEPSNPPSTQALAEQKMMSLKPVDQFWLSLLREGNQGLVDLHVLTNHETDWESGYIILNMRQRQELVKMFGEFVETKRLKGSGTNPTHKALVTSGRLAIGLDKGKDKRGDVEWHIPSLAEARECFERYIGAEPGSIFGGE